MKPEELFFVLNAINYQPEIKKGKTIATPKVKQGKVFKSKNVLGISPAEYRRQKLGKKGGEE